MAKALEIGSKTAFAMASGDVRAMGQSLKHLFTKESVKAFADMTNKRCHALCASLL